MGDVPDLDRSTRARRGDPRPALVERNRRNPTHGRLEDRVSGARSQVPHGDDVAPHQSGGQSVSTPVECEAGRLASGFERPSRHVPVGVDACEPHGVVEEVVARQLAAIGAERGQLRTDPRRCHRSQRACLERGPKGVVGLRRPGCLQRMGRKEDAELWIRVELFEGRLGLLAAGRDGTLVEGVSEQHEGDDCECRGDDQRTGDGSQANPLPSRCSAPARDGVLDLERRRRRVAVLGAGRQARLGGVEVLPPEEEARIPVRAVPFDGTGEQPRVGVDPFEIRVECPHERISPGLEVILVPQQDPVVRRDPLGHQRVRNRTPHDRDDALARREGVGGLLQADGGGNRVRADDEHERVAALDRAPQLVQPFRRRRDVLPVDPRVLATRSQGLMQPAYEGLVRSGVGDERVGQGKGLRRVWRRAVCTTDGGRAPGRPAARRGARHPPR